MPARPHETHPAEDPLARHAIRLARRRFQDGQKPQHSSPRVFHSRVERFFEALRRQAGRACIVLPYDVPTLRMWIERQLRKPTCPFCCAAITVADFALVYKNPPRRGGAFRLANLLVCCAWCRALKGPLDWQEYRELCLLMQTWPESIRHRFARRLRRRPIPGAPRAA
jgi:hypothetical protein